MSSGIVEVRRPCLVYARVSTEEQNVQQQIAYMVDWLTARGREVVQVVGDVESGRLPLTQRRAFLNALELCKVRGFDMCVFRLDRLTRNWDDVTMIERHFRENWATCALISTCDTVDLSTASGRFNFRVLMAVNCFEPEQMRERQQIGIARAKEEGKYLGGKCGRRWAK